jgi:hypothetical protein
MSWIKKMTQIFSYLIFLFVTVGVLLEVIFRILPTSDSLMQKPVTIADPILKFTENREVTKQIGFNFSHVNTKKINNYGYATDKFFQEKSINSKPVIAVIGDSYVEALQVKNSDAFHAILDDKFENYDFYPIGISGSPLSQYLAFAKFASNYFRPEVYIFLIIDNDFDESFENVKKAPGFHYFDDITGLKLVEYKPSKIKQLARKSAFVRYLHLDLKILNQLRRIFSPTAVNREINTRHGEAFLNIGRKANAKFVQGVKELSLNAQVIILLDGDREAIYSGLTDRDSNSNVNILVSELGEIAKNIANVSVIDLHNNFKNDYLKYGRKFNYDYDYHWNELGHSIAAQALSEKISRMSISLNIR